jgi:hypothetical protein
MRRRVAVVIAVLAGLLVGLAPVRLLHAAVSQLDVAGAHIQLDFEPGAFGCGDAEIRAWVERSATIVERYYGRFPTAKLTLRLREQPGDGVRGGKTFANPDALIRVEVGQAVSTAQLRADWVLVHEMTHLALPDTGDEHAWLSEGIATYVEGVARVQSGNRSETDVWAEEMRAMPRGMPQDDDRGLDHTHTWGRTYWGGAIFCLLADVQIRRSTQLRYGLQDSLRAVLAASGGLSADWPIERVLRVADAAVGTRTLEDLYGKMKDAPMAPDLAGLWRQLGVEGTAQDIQLDEHAPLANVRQAIMRPR